MIRIIQGEPGHGDRYGDELAALFHATGPTTYDYQFGKRATFDALAGASWHAPGSLFGSDGTRLALDGEELLGVEVSFPGPEFELRKRALAPLWAPLIEQRVVTEADLAGMGRRTYQCSFLNPRIPDNAYYIHAIAVKPEHRGRGVGARLITHALEAATQAGFRALHLDVLSDNPAVAFYRSLGFECLVETCAPVPREHGVPMEMRMAIELKR